MEKPAQSITLSIDSRLEDTVLVAMAVRGLCAMTGLRAEEINRVELCVVEITNNAVEHAYENTSGHRIEALINLSVDKLEIVVSDWGLSMNSTVSADPMDKESLNPSAPDTWQASGRGLSIVDQLMDEVSYVSADGKNSFYMTWKLN